MVFFFIPEHLIQYFVFIIFDKFTWHNKLLHLMILLTDFDIISLELKELVKLSLIFNDDNNKNLFIYGVRWNNELMHKI